MMIFLEVQATVGGPIFLVNVDQIQTIKPGTIGTSKIKVAGVTEFVVQGTPQEIMNRNGFYQRDPNE